MGAPRGYFLRATGRRGAHGAKWSALAIESGGTLLVAADHVPDGSPTQVLRIDPRR